MGGKRPFALALNNRNGYRCGRVIAEAGDEPEFLLLHPSSEARFDGEILSLFPRSRVIRWKERPCEEVTGLLREAGIELLLSVNFGYVIPPVLLNMLPEALNLHTGLLPWCRGSNPNVWAIVERSPAGVTLHRMTEELDRGEIVASLDVPVDPGDTGASLYERLEEASVTLMRTVWPALREGAIEGYPMENGGSEHKTRDMKALCRLDLDEIASLGVFLDRLRALTFPPYRNAYFVCAGRRYYVDINIRSAEETSGD
ncbi:formyl transferase [Aminithiophilus ramosus]|uniref:Formyl transferase n=2 Tax=Synergistales TaxID=649776 RepID=A0A9Q7AL45_9BACT|nr:formyltransferase family protein [Aminithiophilus ramosus]QTX31468.1 formyl transferase [Aminithiophilus ramosus]QVL35276.1 formyl transferase [Synergistota bacterium]